MLRRSMIGIGVVAFLFVSVGQVFADEGARGKEIYSSTCHVCHGDDGTGNIPGAPDFTKKDGVLQKDDTLLLEHMTNGFQSAGSPMAMPPKGGNPGFTDDDMKGVLQYIRSAFQK